MNKQHIVWAVVIIILIALGFWLWPRSERVEAPTLTDIETTEIDEVDIAPETNPLESVTPTANPLEKTNPFR